MKSKWALGMSLVLGALVAAPVIAEPGMGRGPGRPGPGHGPGPGRGPIIVNVGTVDQAAREARDLQDEVMRARMNRDVVRAVRNLVQDVNSLEDCANASMSRDPRGFRVDLEVPRECERDLRDAIASLDDVGFELRRAGPLNIRVLRQFEATKDALGRLRVGRGGGGGHGGGRLIECVAVDTGHEEHFGGHFGNGETVARAERSALRACERLHGSCEIRRCRTAR